MSTLFVASDWPDALRRRRGTGWTAQRALWFAGAGDLVILPNEPDREFVSYLADLRGFDPGDITVLVPPPGVTGVSSLTVDRLLEPGFLAEVLERLGRHSIERVEALWPDQCVARFTAALGLERALRGQRFIGEGGGSQVNGKALFRMLATGSGVPIAAGSACFESEELCRVTAGLVAEGSDVILKRNYASGGAGNVVVTTNFTTGLAGAARCVHVADARDLADAVRDAWVQLSDDGRQPVIAEMYVPGCRSIFAEYRIEDDGLRFGACGEMVYDPLPHSEVLPVGDMDAETVAALRDHAERLCELYRRMGYRGNASVDAVVTADGVIRFTELNARITGSTYLYDVIGASVVGDYERDRVLIERVPPASWQMGSLAEVLRVLRADDLHWDPLTRTGVLAATPHHPKNGVVLCAVSRSHSDGYRLQTRLDELFTPPRRVPVTVTTVGMEGR
jgi:Pre ATP-grasp domain